MTRPAAAVLLAAVVLATSFMFTPAAREEGLFGGTTPPCWPSTSSA
ncbi:MAG: hypothetical protein M5U09_15845 [Gammaproteobacteria bacterium]|nr:hypothetical protein [Gammaproteobacteria bacterium]